MENRSNHKESRRRLTRPKILTIFALIFFILPATNYYLAVRNYNLDLFNSHLPGSPIGIGLIIFSTISVMAAIGLLLVKQWGIWAFSVAALLSFAYNTYMVIANPEAYNLPSFLQALLILTAAGYMGRKEIFDPFFNPIRRGWRRAERQYMRAPVIINGVFLKTSNINETGIFANWPGCDLDINQPVKVTLNLYQEAIDLYGGVVRVNRFGAGIAFRNLTNDTKKSIRQWIKTKTG